MFCPSCGKEVNGEWAFCPCCGNAIPTGKKSDGLRTMQFDDGETIPYDADKAREFLLSGNVPRQVMSCSIDREGQTATLRFFRTRFNTYFVVLVINDPKEDFDDLIVKDSLEAETAIDLLSEELENKSGSHELNDSLEWISLDDKGNHFGLALEDYTAFDDYQKDRKESR